MSARAALRLETLGFARVFRYTPGKQDWFASGLPREGRLASVSRAGDLARTDVPVCGLADRVGEVRERAGAAGWGQCLVVDERRVVLGRLQGDALSGALGASVEEVMEPGPTTTRPNSALGPLVERMRERRVESIVVTTSDGELVGVLVRADAERRLADDRATAEDGPPPARDGTARG